MYVRQIWDNQELSIERNNLENKETKTSVIYVVEDVDDERQACDVAWAAAPGKLYDKIPKVRVSPEERCGERIWKVKIDYEFSSLNSSFSDDEVNPADDLANANGTNEVTFDCSSTTQTVVKPWRVKPIVTGGVEYDCQRLVYPLNDTTLVNPSSVPIGWNGKLGAESDASGVEIMAGDIREQYKRRMPYQTARSINWRRKIASLQNSVNLKKFKGWEKGEALFLGASYDTAMKGARYVDVTFTFSIRLNEANAMVGNISIGDVYGHDYVWCVYDNAPQVIGNITYIQRKIRYVFVSQVYPYYDFDQLGIK